MAEKAPKGKESLGKKGLEVYSKFNYFAAGAFAVGAALFPGAREILLLGAGINLAQAVGAQALKNSGINKPREAKDSRTPKFRQPAAAA